MNYSQILNGAIDPSWVMAGAFVVICFLLIRILNRIEKRIEQHDQKLFDHALEITILKAKSEGQKTTLL